MSRRVSRHYVQFGTASAIDIIVSPRANHAVAVHKPRTTKLWIARRGEPVGKASFRGIGIGIYEGSKCDTACRTLEFGGNGLLRVPDRLLTIGICPLNHIVVLRPDYCGAVVVLLACEGLDVGYMMGRELRCKLDNHSAGGKL